MNTLRFFNHYVHVRALLLGLLQFAVLLGAAYVAVVIRFDATSARFEEGPVLIFIQVLVFAGAGLMGMIAVGLYHSQQRDGHLQIMLRVAAGFIVAIIALITLSTSFLRCISGVA